MIVGRRHGLLAALFVLALVPRLIGVDWHGAHPDELPQAAARVLAGDLTAGVGYYPPLLSYLCAIGNIVLFGIGLIARWWDGIGGFRDAYFADRTAFLITGRVVTALISATAAPIAFALARTMGADRRGAIAIGALLAVLPGAVFWAHIAKADSGLGPAYLLVALTLFRLIARPESRSRRIAAGVALALAVSFKHSGIFFVLPAIVAIGGGDLRHWRRWLGVALIAGIAWIPMNIGILIDPQRFIISQQVQTQMSVRSATAGETAQAILTALTSPTTGLPIWLLVLCLADPVLAAALLRGAGLGKLGRLIAATLAACVIVGTIAGDRQPAHLWLPFITLAAFILGHSAVLMIGTRRRAPVIVGALLFVIVGAAFAVRTAGICREALTPPIAVRAGVEVRRAAPPGTRVLTAIDLSRQLPYSPVGIVEERARTAALARKYGVTVQPPTAKPSGVPGGYVFTSLPVAIGGMERAAEDAPVLAGAWPIQRAEWRLDHWLRRGYRLFVLSPDMAPFPVYQAMFDEIAARCPLRATITAQRRTFAERDVLVYDCAGVRPAG